MVNKENLIIVIFLSIIALSAAQTQLPECDPSVVTWHPHPRDCTLYLICFHGVLHNMTCAPGLHFSREELKCMLPEDAGCDFNFMCPEEDDDLNPVFLPDPDDCGIYYVCSRGTPIQRECAPGFWFDVRYLWCNHPDQVECDDRTIINPPNPGNRTTISPPVTDDPDIGACLYREDMFVGNSYLKSMCIIGTSANYEAARQGCQNVNMNLFIIDNSLVQEIFFETNTRLLQAHANGFVWINGMRNETLDQWSIFNADGTWRGLLKANEVDWVSTDTVDGRRSGNCLRYSQQFGPYQAMGVECTASSWFVCEYLMQTSEPPSTTPQSITPTTTTTVITTPQLTTTTEDPLVIPPNIAACRNAVDLYHNENYLKSMCIISTATNYEAAQNLCRTNGMELFIISDLQVQAVFRDTTLQVLSPENARGFLWINGRISGDCATWHIFDPNPRPMFGGVHFLQTDEISGQTSGPCLRFSGQHSDVWFAMGTACESSSWLVCEYDQNNVVGL